MCSCRGMVFTSVVRYVHASEHTREPRQHFSSVTEVQLLNQQQLYTCTRPPLIRPCVLMCVNTRSWDCSLNSSEPPPSTSIPLPAWPEGERGRGQNKHSNGIMIIFRYVTTATLERRRVPVTNPYTHTACEQLQSHTHTLPVMTMFARMHVAYVHISMCRHER